ncbi:diguanylate cyclase domain-containing protein [Nitrosomonas aestuarii]|uniref:diguanylate cyclase domain-containing protein n=1 Tax=Nitrosomonas aestuarii TaxID=52441 RepID=UPI000D31AC2D|nr:diguanylate cyclase [Nitrosomonas aestuarii]PTN12525.1 PAS domain S-box-containing protein/diguanylate cyclase (GGDEF)-like protein [Nitrosomonas aestuarii]
MYRHIQRWLNNIGVRNKLILYVTIPIIAILFFAISGAAEKYQYYKNSRHTYIFLSMVIKLDNLIFEMQKERGISTGLIETGSTFFQKEINAQRELTNSALRSYLQQKKDIDFNFINGDANELSSDLDKSLYALPVIRSNIDSVNFGNTIEKFSALNAQGINFIRNLQQLSSNQRLNRLIDAYNNLLWLRERAGQERATLIWVFASGEINADYFRQIISYIESQETLLKNFAIKTPLEYRDMLQQQLSHPVNEKVTEFRNAAINKVVRNELLNELQSLIGYGGFIYNYKNYVINGDKVQLENILHLEAQVQDLFKRFKDIPGMTREDHVHLTAIEETFDNYFRMVAKITTLKQQGIPIQTIDEITKVDDTSALQAISYFRKGLAGKDAVAWWKNSTERINLIKEASDQLKMSIHEQTAANMHSAKRSLWLFINITLVTLMLSLILGILIMRRLVSELKNISSSMRRMFIEHRYDQPLLVTGRDEVGIMAQTFNQLMNERQKFETELRLSAEVFANLTEAIMIANADRQISMVNPAFVRVSGYCTERILGEDFLFMSEAMEGEVVARQMWNKLLIDSHWEGEVWHKKPDGQEYLVWLNVSVVKDTAGVITHYIGMFTDITQRKQYEESIWYQANFDALTSLPNRKMCMDRLSEELKIAERMNTQLAVLFIDLDRFKQINDTLGHHAGDNLLIEIATRLKNCVRKSDIVARLGGDEFVIILKNYRIIPDILMISGKILAVLSERVFLREKSETFTSGSIGIALFPQDGKDIETLMKQADAAMYQCKQAGRNKFLFYNDEIQRAVMLHMKTEHELLNIDL